MHGELRFPVRLIEPAFRPDLGTGRLTAGRVTFAAVDAAFMTCAGLVIDGGITAQ